MLKILKKAGGTSACFFDFVAFCMVLIYNNFIIFAVGVCILKRLNEKEIMEAIDSNIFEFVTKEASLQDDSVCFSYFGKKTLFGTFKKTVLRLVPKLLSLPDIQPKDRVLISQLTTPESIALIYACNYAGLTPVMVDIRLSAGEMCRIITNLNIKYAFITDVNTRHLSLISKPDCLKKLYIVSVVENLGFPMTFFQKFACFFTRNPYMFERIGLNKVGVWKDFLRLPDKELPNDYVAPKGDSELIFSTSGSTGEKKFVRQTARAINYNVCFNDLLFDFQDPSFHDILAFMPIFICFGFAASVHMGLYYGMHIHIHPIYDMRKLPDVFMKVKPNMFLCAIGHWERILNSPKVQNGDLSFLKFALYSGEKCEPERLNRFNELLKERGSETMLLTAYGMTELTVCAMQYPHDFKYGATGKPIPGAEIRIAKEGEDEFLPVGETGEVCVHSPSQTLGYLCNEDETKKLLHLHSDGKVWVHTGDLGFVDEDGFLYIIGRIKNMQVSVSGTKIFLPAIENALLECDDVEKVAAVPVRDEERNDIKAIFVFLTKKGDLSDSALKRKCKNLCDRELPWYLQPDYISVLKKMPLTSSGKIDYPTLEEEAKKISLKVKVNKITVK